MGNTMPACGLSRAVSWWDSAGLGGTRQEWDGRKQEHPLLGGNTTSDAAQPCFFHLCYCRNPGSMSLSLGLMIGRDLLGCPFFANQAKTLLVRLVSVQGGK